jgi:molybdopterin-guanine dinucleotide biosynthesis protein A
MIKEELVEYFSKNCDDRGIPNVKSKDWKTLITTYEKDDIRQSLAEYIHKNKIPFPTNDCELYEVNGYFTDFLFSFSFRSI